jgi:transposase-like protein
MEEKIRRKAIKRYLNGEEPVSIYKDIGRSKQWFFKWLRRYKTGKNDWFKNHSRAPKTNPNRIPDSERQRIIKTRKRLESEPFAQVGASAIKWELKKAGDPFPSDSTINRVLKNEDLIKKKRLRSQGGGLSLFCRSA